MDYDGYYKIKCDSQNIIWGGFEKAPDYERFRTVFLNRINIPDRHEYICEDEHAIVGYLAAAEEKNIVEISYGVLTQASGKGIATALIKNAIMQYPNKTFVAWVSEHNVGSEKCLMKNGFIKLNEVETRFLALKGTQHRFYKWERKSV